MASGGRFGISVLLFTLASVIVLALASKYPGLKPVADATCPVGGRCPSLSDDVRAKALIIRMNNQEDPIAAVSKLDYFFEYLYQPNVSNPEIVLILVSSNSVVTIGKNQNPYKEVRMNLLQEDGMPILRRGSGGGAAFSDLGCLSFLMYYPAETAKAHKVQNDGELPIPTIKLLVPALNKLGVPCAKSGRNDVVVDGRKVSGSAGYERGAKVYMGSSLLFDVNITKLGRYLSPSRAKLESKGIKSVEARVMNLKYSYPDLTPEKINDAVIETFFETYPQYDVEFVEPDEEALANIPEYLAFVNHNKDPDWLYGSSLEFSIKLNNRFTWGQFVREVQIESEGKLIISAVKIFSDCMEDYIPNALKTTLVGVPYSPEGVKTAIDNAKALMPPESIATTHAQLDEFAEWLTKAL